MQNTGRRRRTIRELSPLLVLALVALGACGEDQTGVTRAAYPHDDTLRLNQIQVVGSHNSYHIQPRPELLPELLALPIAQGIIWSVDGVSRDAGQMGNV